MPIITFPYQNAVNYTLVGAEIAGGEVVLSDVVPANATFHADYKLGVNGVWGNGILTGTPVGGAAVVGGYLDLKGYLLKFVDYDADLNADSQQVGCIRFVLRPNYTGAPVGKTQFFVSIGEAEGVARNGISIHHDATSGNLRVAMTDSVGTVFTTVLGAWSPTAGVDYEFELNYDLTTGATRLFIDGVQFGATITSVFARSANIAIMRIGNAFTTVGGATSFQANFEMRDLVVYDTVQHVANFVSPITPPPQFTTGTVLTNTIIEAEDFASFAATLATPGGGTVLFGLQVDGALMYWNGAAWVASDGTASQLNTAADINTNIGTIVSSPSSVRIFARLTALDPIQTPSLDEVVINYDFGGVAPGDSPLCTVYGFVRDLLGQPLEGVTVTITPQWPDWYDEDLAGTVVLMGEPQVATTNADGRFEFDLIQGAKIRIKFQGSTGSAGILEDLSITVPQAQSLDVTDQLEPITFPAN